VSRLVLVRHGESEWNAERRVQGQSGTGLTDQGREQAERTGQLLAEVYPGAVLVASDLRRTWETAAPLARRLGRAPRFERGLRERHFGWWTGLLASEIGERDPDRWKRWHAGEDVIGEVGGEDARTLVGRVVTSVRRLLAGAAGRPVVCVTHGGPVWHGTRALLGLGDRVLGGVANCGVTEIDLELDEGGAWLVSWNQVAHLPVALRMVERAVDGKPAGAGDQEGPPVGT
jgi:broad specificity phosphatase PhoE